MTGTTDEFGTPFDQTEFPMKETVEYHVDKIPAMLPPHCGAVLVVKDHFGPDLGVKDVSEMPAARPGQGAKL